MCCASVVRGAVLIKRTKLFSIIASSSSARNKPFKVIEGLGIISSSWKEGSKLVKPSCCALRDSGRSYKCEGRLLVYAGRRQADRKPRQRTAGNSVKKYVTS